MKRKPPNLRRRGDRRSPKRRLIVFCEGRKTEPVYLVAFSRAFGGGLVEVRPVGGAGVPKTILKRATEERRRIRRSKDSFERLDEVWAAFDRDEHDDVVNCIFQCTAQDVGVAFSNPCIEQWALIHFQNPVSDAPLSRQQAQAVLSSVMPNYDKDGSKVFDFAMMAENYSLAVSNANILIARRIEEGDEYGAPVTTFHFLTERIRDLGQG